MTVTERCVVVEMICSDLVMGMIYGAVVVDDCPRLVSVAIHGGDDRPL